MRKAVRLVFLAALMTALSACGSLPALTLNPQELYARPELPAKYTELSRLLSEIINAGAEYAAPTSGSNIQSMQLLDLDGDGREEAVAYLRNSGEEKPLKVYVFTAHGDSYRLSHLIEGSGTAIYSVAYADLDNDGCQEIAVGWKAAADLQVLEICSIAGSETRTLLQTDYVKYICADLNQDGRQELVVLRAGEEGDSVADYYSWQEDGSLTSRSHARISATMAELSQQGRVRVGILDEERPAIFVTSVTDQSTAVTDILALRDGEFANLVLDAATGVSWEISPFLSLYPTDIENDGRTEVPRVVASRTAESSACRLIEWIRYDLRGNASTAAYTCHDLEDSWYLRLPDTWTDRIYVTRSASSGTFSGEAVVTFYIRELDQPFLRIYALSGSGREMRSVRGERFVLNRQTSTTYAAELLDSGAVWEYAMTEDQVRGAFSVILREWVSGDN